MPGNQPRTRTHLQKSDAQKDDPLIPVAALILDGAGAPENALARSGARARTEGWPLILLVPVERTGFSLNPLTRRLAAIRQIAEAEAIAPLGAAGGRGCFAMLIWIFTEVALIGYSWLQSAYFGLGRLELVLGLTLPGLPPQSCLP